MQITDLVKQYDPSGLFSVLVNSYEQISFALENDFTVPEFQSAHFSNVIISGLGGSAIAGNFLINFLKDELKVPVSVNRNYHLPAYAGKNTLLIISSYSGNTEESISALQQGIILGCTIICLTTGGQIQKIAVAKEIPCIPLKAGYQPRYAFGVSFFTLLKLFGKLKLAPDHTEFTEKAVACWKKLGEEYSKEGNAAFLCAEKIKGRIPVILGVADVNNSLAMRLKAQFNENSKMHAFSASLPEQNHNEIVAWETFDSRQTNLITMIFTDEDFHPQIKKRFEVLYELLAKVNCGAITLEGTGGTFKERMIELIYLGDWISYYAALTSGKDPAEIDNIHYLKKKLAE